MALRKTKTRGAKPVVVWTDFALRDLERIDDHIAQDGPITARIAEGVSVEVHYPSVRELRRRFAPEFRLRRWQGV